MLCQEFHGFALSIGFYSLINRTFLIECFICFINTANIGCNMTHITSPLYQNLSIEFFQFVEIFTLFTYPIDKVVGNCFEVVNSILARLHGIITKILSVGSWINRIRSLTAIEITGIIGSFCSPFVKYVLLLFDRHVPKPGVAPFNGPFVVLSNSWMEVGYSIAWLCNVVEACVVHDGRSRSVVIGVGWRSKRIDRSCIAGAEIMRQAERVAHFVSCNKPDQFAHNLIFKLSCLCFRVCRCGL